MLARRWPLVVDSITVVWLVAFIASLISSSERTVETCELVTLCLLPVFIADLVLLFRRESDFKTFLKKRWFDVLLVIPYFRILRILRLAKFLRTLKILKAKKALGQNRMMKKEIGLQEQ